MEGDFKKEVGRRLYNARKLKGYSRAKVGELVGLHETTVKRYEDGLIKSLDIQRMKTFASVLGTTASNLLGWEVDEEPSDWVLGAMLDQAEEIDSGRDAANKEMFRTYGTDHMVSLQKRIGEKTALLYYNAFDHEAAINLELIISLLESLQAKESKEIYCLIYAYLNADPPIKSVLETIIEPYRSFLKA